MLPFQAAFVDSTPGKQVVYHAIQDPADEATPEELTAIDQEIEDLKLQLASAKSQEKSLRAELAMLNARISTPELRGQVATLETEKHSLQTRLTESKTSATQARTVSVEEKAHVEKNWKTWQRHVAARRKICREMWMRCTEVLPETVQGKEELWESLGLEGNL